MEKTGVTFGEIMGRLTPIGFKRLQQCMPGQIEMMFAGAEANVAVSLAQLGMKSRFVSVVPNNPIGEASIRTLQGLGVETHFVLPSDEGRMGLYFLEGGANQRPSSVIYDRDGSSISVTPASAYPWGEIFQDADWFHVSGITPAISRSAAEFPSFD